ncbi:MAG: hypothetical protein HOP15_08995 [Planctomycetes bacterium]|nr:hypothetical protein [Planctomycetota bacterium]
MKTLPEIDPEIRGLLEEIVADPRSSLRLVPRKPLKSWFESGETVRARDVSGTSAERHLIEAHREALAQLFWEAAKIAYWKAPVMSHRPMNTDGQLYNPADGESAWKARAEPMIRMARDDNACLRLLHEGREGLDSRAASSLARASLSLAPRDRTRCFVVHVIPWDQSRTAVVFQRRLLLRARPSALRSEILLALGARLCSIGLFEQAREAYRSSSRLAPGSPHARFSAFNLSCLLGEDAAAFEEGTELARLVSPGDPRLSDVRDLLRDWSRTLASEHRKTLMGTIARVSNRLPEAALVLTGAYE